MDVGKCQDGRYWMLWASTGIDGFVVKQVEPRSKWFKRLGPAGYLAKTLFLLPRFSGLYAEVVVDDRRLEGDFLLINASNCRMFAGGELRLNANGVLDDGMFEVWFFRGHNLPSLLAYTIEVGLESHRDDPNIEIVQGQTLTVDTVPPMDYQLDGELGHRTPFACAIQPRALRVLAPDTAPSGLFSCAGEPLPG